MASPSGGQQRERIPAADKIIEVAERLINIGPAIFVNETKEPRIRGTRAGTGRVLPLIDAVVTEIAFDHHSGPPACPLCPQERTIGWAAAKVRS